MNNPKISGTREWAVKNVNIATGCSHRCRYCYARGMALRFGRIPDAEAWGKMKIRHNEARKHRRKVDGRIMFPSTHDITPEILPECLLVLRKLLEAGNDVLIVSKPHYECIARIVDEFWLEHNRQILFRFTIGTVDDEVLSYWEPGAPTFVERLASLKHAFDAQMWTSVSCEPMLGDPVELLDAVRPYVTDSVWFGKMNKVRQWVAIETDADRRRVAEVEARQHDAAIRRLHDQLHDPLVRWKESIKAVVGLELATEAGLDV